MRSFGGTPPNIDPAVARSAKVGLARKFIVKLPDFDAFVVIPGRFELINFTLHRIKTNPYLLFPNEHNSMLSGFIDGASN